MRSVATISTAHCYIKISDFYGEFAAQVIQPFCKAHLYKIGKIPIPGSRKTGWKVTHVFARSNFERDEYRLPRSLLKEFLEFAQSRGYNPTRIKIEVVPELVGIPTQFEFQPGYENTRPGQDEWINYQLAPGPVKVNNASTGFGKTYMALRTMLKLGQRSLITVQPRYVATWIKALGDILKLKPEDVLVWEQDLSRLPDVLARGDVNPKIIILTITRIDVYLRNEKKDAGVPSLDHIFDRLGCGLRIIDEGHESIHQICMSLFYGNFPKLLLLSATLTADDPFINKIYKIMFPFHIRLKEPEPENYIDVVAYLYDINPRKYNLKTMQFGSYNDLTWEQSILGNKAVFQFYFEVAKKAFEDYYLNVREEGTKCLFFFSRVNMCEAMLAKFQEHYPGMDFATFTGEDTKGKDADKDKYLKHEIVITTPGSCGTGKDIRGLVSVISFHMVSSQQRNKQMIGRLRELLKMFGGLITPTFVFPVCKSQPKHRDYTKKREIAFEAKKKSFKFIDSFCSLD